MPVTHFACPPNKPTAGEVHGIEHCVIKCASPCYSPQMMTAIWWTNARNPHTGRYVSATALSGCKRRLQLERTVDVAETYDRLWASFRGSLTHSLIEAAVEAQLPSGRSMGDLGFLSEITMKAGFCFVPGHGGFQIDPETDVDDLATYATMSCPKCEAEGLSPREQETIILGGTMDLGVPEFLDGVDENGLPKIHIDEEGTAWFRAATDTKTKKEFALAKGIKGDEKNTFHPQVPDDYVRQISVYSYLAETCPPPPQIAARGAKRIKFREGHIQYFAMGDAPYSGAGTFLWKDHYTKPLKAWPMYPIVLWDRSRTEEYIRVEAKKILNSLVLGKERGELRPDDKAYLCKDYCSFYATDYCPNPTLEANKLALGLSREEAFQAALREPAEMPEPVIGELDDRDLHTINKFFAKQRGEEAPPEPEKPARKPRKNATADGAEKPTRGRRKTTV